MNRYAVVFTVVMIVFMATETMIVTAQEQINSTNSDKQEIIVTWLDANKTKTDTVPVISISDEDFWKIFKPLLEQSNK